MTLRLFNEKQSRDLQRVKLAIFTIPYLYNDVFKCKGSTARNILMPWTRSGIVYASNNKIKVEKSNLINVYTFSDIRIARHVRILRSKQNELAESVSKGILNYLSIKHQEIKLKPLETKKKSQKTIKLKINNEIVEVEGYFENGTNYVPVRIVEKLGYTVSWDYGNKIVVVE